MKIRLTRKQIENIVSNPDKAAADKIKINDPWWVIALKVVAYLIGLILAGACTTIAARAAGVQVEAIVDSIAVL